jgi:hypothetical protein
MDTIKLDVPLFLRLLELAREDVSDDADLHDIAEAVTKISQDDVATMADYNGIVSFMNKQGKEESASEGVGDYVGRKLGVKVTQGKPNPKNAPRWATSLGQTPQGAWHWLEKKGPLETPDSDRYFPLSGKTEFTGFVSDYEQQGMKEDHSPEDPDASYNVGEYDREGDMAKDQLRIIADAAQELYNLIKVNDNLPEWVQKKITLATDYIDTVRDYIKANAENYGQPEAVDELDRIKQLGGIG